MLPRKQLVFLGVCLQNICIPGPGLHHQNQALMYLVLDGLVYPSRDLTSELVSSGTTDICSHQIMLKQRSPL